MTKKPKQTPKEELECPKYVYDTGIIFECKDGCKFQILDEDVVKLLNELTTKCSQLEKENEQLKQSQASTLREFEKSTKRIQKLTRENEQLKSTLQSERRDLISTNNDYSEKLFKCRKENEQLKQQNKNLFEKLKFTAEQLNYSENLKKMLDGDVE